ncbi:MAG: hypothetical protein ABUT20_39970, partial [Bacteroidota bacterium]
LIFYLSKSCLAAEPDLTGPEAFNKYFNDSESKYKYRFTLTTFFIFNGGWGASLAAGSWVEMKGTQPSLSITLNVYGKGRSLGNALFYGEDVAMRKRKKGTLFNSDKTFFNPNRTLATVVF